MTASGVKTELLDSASLIQKRTGIAAIRLQLRDRDGTSEFGGVFQWFERVVTGQRGHCSGSFLAGLLLCFAFDGAADGSGVHAFGNPIER